MSRNVKKIGITGGIGSGKSEATAILREMGFNVIDADEVAREAAMPGEPAMLRLREEFGDGVFLDDGSLDRKALANLMFHDPDILAKVNGIFHSDIIARMEKAAGEVAGDTDEAASDAVEADKVASDADRAASDTAMAANDTDKAASKTGSGANDPGSLAGDADKLIFISAPLLFETGMRWMVDETWLVAADEDVRLRRTMERDGLSEEAARARMRNQMPEDEKRALADRVIENNGTLADLRAEVQNLVQDLV